MNQFGTKPLTPGPASPFTSKFPAGVRVQFAILPEAEFAQVGDQVGIAQVWEVTTALSPSTASVTLPVYRVGSNFQIFKGATGLTCTVNYVATTGLKPKIGNTG